jgi:L-tartrate/succinate antiporter
MGKLTSREIELAILVMLALALWIFGGSFIDATTVALVTIALMLVIGVISWDDVISNKQAWNTLAWFATLVALAAGLSQVGFVKWLAGVIGAHMGGFEPVTVMVVLVLAFYFLHYMFASITAHVTALLPVFLSVGAAIPGMDMKQYTVMLLMTLGIMGILTPYATGPSPVYYGSGYIPSGKFWMLGAIFGVVFIAALLIIGLPWVRMSFGAA